MPKFKISNDYIAQCNDTELPTFPKYTTQVLNLANQNAGATKPARVGQLSELLPEYLRTTYDPTLEGWKEFYLERYPTAIDEAVERIYAQVQNLKDCMKYIDKGMVREWTEDLVYNKTYNGLCYQAAILKRIAELEGTTYRLATPEEEAQNIDGYVGDTPYQVKPDSYEYMNQLHENIECKIAKYTKRKDGISVEY